MKSILPATLLIFLFVISCNTKNNDSPNTNTALSKNMEMWADTIIYDVLILNPDSTDEWQSQKLKRLNHKKLIDDLFNSVYSGKKSAYNYYTNEPYSIDDIKEFEKEYLRKDIGKLQFEECWRYDSNSGNIEKQIYSILVAYTLYNSSGDIRGYKAGFYLKNN